MSRLIRRGTARLPARPVAVAVLLLGAGTAAAALVVPPAPAIRLLVVLVAGGFGAVAWLLRGIRSADRAALRELGDTVDLTQRRVVAAVERDRLARTDLHRDLTGAVERACCHLDRRIAAVHRDLEAGPGVPAQRLGDRVAAPGGPVDPVELLDLLLLVRQERPSRVLHLGGGTSAVWVAALLQHNGGHLVAVDPDAEHAVRTRTLLAAHGLTDVAQAREAPSPAVDDGRQCPGPDPQEMADQHDVDLLVVGAAAVSGGGRRPFPVPAARLAAAATVVVLDPDGARAGDLGRWWAAEVPGLSAPEPGPGRYPVLRYRRPAS